MAMNRNLPALRCGCSQIRAKRLRLEHSLSVSEVVNYLDLGVQRVPWLAAEIALQELH